MSSAAPETTSDNNNDRDSTLAVTFDEPSPTSSVEIVFHDAKYYGYDDPDEAKYADTNDSDRPSFHRRVSQELMRRSSSVRELVEPKTPAGWVVFLATIASLITMYEVNLQTSLTGPPNVYGQINDRDATAHTLYNYLKQHSSTLQQPMRPSLFVGTRAIWSSLAGYLLPGPQSIKRQREILKLPDGAQVALDWEYPSSNRDGGVVVLILHGINNDAGFGYVRSLMKQVNQQGWTAAGFNFRGCGGVPLLTPRMYNGSYTGDLRSVVQILSRRDTVKKLVIVGNSLGANLVAKYLGEEGERLPECVIAGVTLGNPMHLDSRKTHKLFAPVLASGVKVGLLKVYKNIQPMIKQSELYRDCIRNAWKAWGLAEYDQATAIVTQRNATTYPFVSKIGYAKGQEYWTEASSFQYVPNIAVPFLQLVAADDFLVHEPFRRKLCYNLANPNALVMQTTCGGHLGWHHGPYLTSWADGAVTDFVRAVVEEAPPRMSVRSQRSRL